MTEEILVVGGGTGGTVLVNRLADDLAAEIDAGEASVTLVSDGPDHVYKPVYLYVAFGQREAADARRPLREVVDRRVDVVDDRAVDVDPDEKRLVLADRGARDYDHLVVATGATLDLDATPGVAAGAHHFYGPDGATALRDELADFESGHLVLSVVGTPHMCPAAPLEFVLMVDDWLRERGRREDVDLTYTYPIGRAHAIPSIAEWVTPLMAERDVEVETFVNVESVDPDAETVATMEGETLDYDLLVAIPDHDGSQFVRDAGLGDGWIDVDRHTLEVPDADGLYAIGDAADVPTSKAGSVAHYEAGTVAARIASRVRGQTPTARYGGKTVCFVETGMDEATFVSFEYGEEPTVRTPSRAVHWAKLAYNESYWLTARGLL